MRANARGSLPSVIRSRGLRWIAIGSALLLVACGSSRQILPAATSISQDESLPTFPIDSSVVSASTNPASTDGTAPSTSGSLSSVPPATDQNSWENATVGLVDLPSECGNMSKVVARTDQDTLIASVALQGLWASTNGVDAWTKLGTGPGSAKITNRATTLIFDPQHPSTFWEAGIYAGGGVYRTDDGGVTFHQLGDVAHVEALSVDLSDPFRRTMLATMHETANVFLSTDGGATWQDISDTLPPEIGYASGPVVINSNTFVLGTSNDPASEILRSTDAGKTWTVVYDAGPIRTPLRAQSDGALYWLLERVNGVLVSHDDGATWSLVTPTNEVLPSGPSLTELPDGTLATLGVGGVVISRDHGQSWERVGPDVPFTPENVVYSPFRKAFYIWHAECDFSSDNKIQTDSIMRLNFDPAAA